MITCLGNRELVNKLKRKRSEDQGKGDSVRHQKVSDRLMLGFFFG